MANTEQIEQTKRLGDFPAAQPGDDAPRDIMAERAEEMAHKLDDNLEAEVDEETGEVHASMQGTPINPSSTYPGRNMELLENDMRIPTPIDLAKRAKFAGSQIPAEVHAAGLVDENGNILVDLDDDFVEEQEENEEE